MFATPAQAAAPNIDLRTVDWAAVIAAEPQIGHPDAPALDSVGGPFVEAANGAYGYALVDGVEYGDISGDGKDEAVIALYSGGTAGTTGLLIYADGGAKPRFVTAVPGYKVYGRPENGRLRVEQPVYAGWEPNCCPSGLSRTRYQLRGSRLVAQGSSSMGYEAARPQAVEHFYELLAARQYADAYALLGRRFRAANPVARWRAGYARTTELRVDAAANAGGDRTLAVVSAVDGGKRTRYLISWQMSWSAAGKTWLLDQPKVTTLPLDIGVIAGALSYPSEGIPPLTVFARDVNTGQHYQIDTVQNQTAFALLVPAGTYEVFAYPQGDAAFGGGYTQFVPCGQNADCADHSMIAVKVDAGGAVAGVDVVDWYAPAGAIPPRP